MSLTRPRAHQLLDIDFKQSVRVVTTTNISLNGGAPDTVDDVSLQKSDRVLVTGQSTGSQNGIYKVQTVGTGSNGTWIRASDANDNGDITAGIFLTVTEGTTYGDTRWKLITPDPISIGSTTLTFTLQSTSLGNNSFGNIKVGADYVLADQPGDLVEIIAGNNMIVSGYPLSDSISFAVSDDPSFSGNVTVALNKNIFLGTHGKMFDDGNFHLHSLADGSFWLNNETGGTIRINNQYDGGVVLTNGVGNVTIESTSASSSTSTGGLTVVGGVGIGGNLNVGSTLTAGSINGTPVGNASPSSATFTSLQATGIVTLSPADSAVNLSPSGTGYVSISPATEGSINKMKIGNVTPSSGVFTTLSATSINSTPIGNSTPSSGSFTTLTSNSTTSLGATSATAINSTPVGNATPSTGAFTTLSSNSTTSLGATSATAINSTPIGNATPSTGAFTSLTANGAVTLTQDTASSSTSTGTLVVTGGTGISGNAYVGGNLVVTGNLTINGTTSTVNSTTVTVDDPIFTLGGDTAPGADDNKDRGIEFRWHNGSAAKVGFFGHDDSTGRFTYIPDATNTSEVFSGTTGDAQFGTVYATATSAQYADLAEYYLADQSYEPGTVVILGGPQEITQSTTHADTRVAGIISTNPAYIMNDSLKGIGLPVALTGRVPCKVLGYAHKGDLMVSSNIPGVAVAWGDSENPPAGSIIGKCLVNKTQVDVDLVEVLVGRY